MTQQPTENIQLTVVATQKQQKKKKRKNFME